MKLNDGGENRKKLHKKGQENGEQVEKSSLWSSSTHKQACYILASKRISKVYKDYMLPHLYVYNTNIYVCNINI